MRFGIVVGVLALAGGAGGFALEALQWSLAPTLIAGFGILVVLTLAGIAAALFFRRSNRERRGVPAFSR